MSTALEIAHKSVLRLEQLHSWRERWSDVSEYVLFDKLASDAFWREMGFHQWQIDYIQRRTDRSGWPTRDAAAPQEEC